MKWFSPTKAPFEIEGLVFMEKDGVYRRLQINPPKPLPNDVAVLANHTAGAKVRFRANLSKLSVKTKLIHTANTHDHMPATCESGIDCYISREGEVRFCHTSRIDRTKDEYEAELINREVKETFNIELNLPLYNGLYQLLIGVDDDAEVYPPVKRENEGRIVVYGTSITQGGCASRPGMCYTNILSRKLDTEVVNLGFSGAGKVEAEVALAIREIDNIKLLILDTDANCPDAAWISEKYPEFLRLFRERHPDVPVLITTIIPTARILHEKVSREFYKSKFDAQVKVYEDLLKNGDQNVYFMDGHDLLPNDTFEENTVDGVHATDLGFWNMACAFEAKIREIIQ